MSVQKSGTRRSDVEYMEAGHIVLPQLNLEFNQVQLKKRKEEKEEVHSIIVLSKFRVPDSSDAKVICAHHRIRCRVCTRIIHRR